MRGRDRPARAAARDAAAVVAAGGRRRGAGAGARGLGGRDGRGGSGPEPCRPAFGGAAGFGRRPAVVVVDLIRGFTDPACALGADLDDVVAATRAVLDAARAAGRPGALHHDRLRRGARARGRGVPAQGPAPSACCGRARRGSSSTSGWAGARTSRCWSRRSPRRSGAPTSARGSPTATRSWSAARPPRAASARRSSTRSSTGSRRSCRARRSATAGPTRTRQSLHDMEQKYGDVLRRVGRRASARLAGSRRRGGRGRGASRPSTPDSHSATPIRASRSTPVAAPSPSSR